VPLLVTLFPTTSNFFFPG